MYARLRNLGGQGDTGYDVEISDLHDIFSWAFGDLRVPSLIPGDWVCVYFRIRTVNGNAMRNGSRTSRMCSLPAAAASMTTPETWLRSS